MSLGKGLAELQQLPMYILMEKKELYEENLRVG